MAHCGSCNKSITDKENYNGWCKPCFDIEMLKFQRFCLRQDGIDESSLTDKEVSMIGE